MRQVSRDQKRAFVASLDYAYDGTYDTYSLANDDETTLVMAPPGEENPSLVLQLACLPWRGMLASQPGRPSRARLADNTELDSDTLFLCIQGYVALRLVQGKAYDVDHAIQAFGHLTWIRRAMITFAAEAHAADKALMFVESPFADGLEITTSPDGRLSLAFIDVAPQWQGIGVGTLVLATLERAVMCAPQRRNRLVLSHCYEGTYKMTHGRYGYIYSDDAKYPAKLPKYAVGIEDSMQSGDTNIEWLPPIERARRYAAGLPASFIEALEAINALFTTPNWAVPHMDLTRLVPNLHVVWQVEQSEEVAAGCRRAGYMLTAPTDPLLGMHAVFPGTPLAPRETRQLHIVVYYLIGIANVLSVPLYWHGLGQVREDDVGFFLRPPGDPDVLGTGDHPTYVAEFMYDAAHERFLPAGVARPVPPPEAEQPRPASPAYFPPEEVDEEPVAPRIAPWSPPVPRADEGPRIVHWNPPPERPIPREEPATASDEDEDSWHGGDDDAMEFGTRLCVVCTVPHRTCLPVVTCCSRACWDILLNV